jgi:DNA-binding NarL/FixJ family response regulator
MMMDTINRSALIATQPGALRSVLQALLLLMPQVDDISEADDTSSASKAIEERRPDLVLLDARLPGTDVFTFVQEIRSKRLQSRCLVLVDDVWQCLDAIAAGADAALLKSTPPSDLYATIEALMGGRPLV